GPLSSHESEWESENENERPNLESENESSELEECVDNFVNVVSEPEALKRPKPPTCPIVMTSFGNDDQWMLFDTGSVATIVGYEVMRDMKAQGHGSELYLPDQEFESASSTPLDILGYFTYPLRCGKTECYAKIYVLNK